MEDIDRYLTIAKASGQAGFLKQFDCLFLLRKPVEKRAPEMERLLGRPSHRTNAGSIDPAEVDLLAELDKEPGWRVAKVKHKSGDKLVIGRLPSCDVYLGLPSVSKGHATFLVEAGQLARVTDDNSTNGTWVKGARIAAGQTVPVHVGDELKFGGVEVKLIDAETFYQHLMTLK